MGLFTKKIGPVFLKENSDAEAYIEKLKELSEKTEGALKQEIEKQIAYAQYGLIGESNIAFELKNSNMDMYILHDIYLECDDLSAQIDYMNEVREVVAPETNREELVKRLKAFRLEQSRKEKIKPYYIFNDAQMEDIIDKNPQTKEELLQVSGFGNVKVEKYGEEIVGILKG